MVLLHMLCLSHFSVQQWQAGGSGGVQETSLTMRAPGRGGWRAEHRDC